MSILLIITGATTAILGRHTVLGIAIGCGMMFAGWLGLEVREVRR